MDFKNEKEELAFLRKYVTDIKKQYIDEKPLSKNGKQYFAMRVSTKRIIEKDKETNDIKNKHIREPQIIYSERYNILDDIKYKALKRYFKEEIIK